LLKWQNSKSAGMYQKIKQILTEKLLDMDFVNVYDTKTQEMLSAIEQNATGGGWGLLRVKKVAQPLF